MVIGTKRLPSAFELPSSTAPARIQSNPLLESNESTFILPNSTTNQQLQVYGVRAWEVPNQGSSSTIQGLQRIAKLDTYQPGTLPERAYKRVAIDNEFKDNIRSIKAKVILESPERPYKPIRPYKIANTAS